MRKTFGDRAFAKAGSFLWNEGPADIRDASTVETFKSRLKTFLFKKAYRYHLIFYNILFEFVMIAL
jgi:hypothetical protein